MTKKQTKKKTPTAQTSRKSRATKNAPVKKEKIVKPAAKAKKKATKRPVKKKAPTKRAPRKITKQTNAQAMQIWENSLSDKQREVAVLLMSGTDRNQIAKLCKLAVKTVDSHRLGLLSALGVGSTVRLVHFGIRNKIIEVTDFG